MRDKWVSRSEAWWAGFLGNRRAKAEDWRLAWVACVRTMRRKAVWSGWGYSEGSGATGSQGRPDLLIDDLGNIRPTKGAVGLSLLKWRNGIHSWEQREGSIIVLAVRPHDKWPDLQRALAWWTGDLNRLSMLETCYLTVTSKWASNLLFPRLTFPLFPNKQVGLDY